MKALGLFLLLCGVAGSALAGPTLAPEIDGGTAVSAIALLSGGVLILRSKLRK